MSQTLRVPAKTVITAWDFSTGGVKCLAFDLEGKTLTEIRLPTDLWTEGGVSELNLMQLEGQARASVRLMADRLRQLGRLDHWLAGGISATHHSAGRIDARFTQVRRAICWNDQSLIPYHARGLERLGGQDRVKQIIGGPWAIRYSLSHLVKDEDCLPASEWKRTWRILMHGPLAAGYLTGNFNAVSVSSAASTGIMDLRRCQWARLMLNALARPEYRRLAWKQLPPIVDQFQPLGQLADSIAIEAGLGKKRPILYPTSDDQQAGLVGGGAVDAGQMAVILGKSAVVNSSSERLPESGTLDAMRLNWGPYLWMRCYNNGAQFLDEIVGPRPDWSELEKQASLCPPGSGGAMVLPFLWPEPSLGVMAPRLEWFAQPPQPGARFRAALEALAYLIALGVREHEQAGQKISRITLSGGIARSELMGTILATVLDRPLQRLQSAEGPALGAAVTALAALENHVRRIKKIKIPFSVADAVQVLVKFRKPVQPNPQWRAAYEQGLKQFEQRLRERQ